MLEEPSVTVPSCVGMLHGGLLKGISIGKRVVGEYFRRQQRALELDEHIDSGLEMLRHLSKNVETSLFPTEIRIVGLTR
jgi:hypothetical protein